MTTAAPVTDVLGYMRARMQAVCTPGTYSIPLNVIVFGAIRFSEEVFFRAELWQKTSLDPRKTLTPPRSQHRSAYDRASHFFGEHIVRLAFHHRSRLSKLQ